MARAETPEVVSHAASIGGIGHANDQVQGQNPALMGPFASVLMRIGGRLAQLRPAWLNLASAGHLTPLQGMAHGALVVGFRAGAIPVRRGG